MTGDTVAQKLSYERYCWFHSETKAGRYPNARGLAEQYGISPKQAQRDIEFARDRLKAPLRFNRRQNGYEYEDTRYELPPIWCSQDELLSLCVALRLAAAVPDKLVKSSLHDLLGKFLDFRSSSPAASIRHMEGKISVKNIEYYRVDEDIFHRALTALLQGTCISINYRTPHTAKETQRTIRPLHLLHYMGNWHLIAYCTLKRELRDFTLSRIRSIVKSDKWIDLPEGLHSIENFIKSSFGVISGDHNVEVRLRFTPAVAEWVSEQIWHHDQKLVANSDGTLDLHFPVSDFREVKREILKFGADVKVLEPVELREEVKKEIEKMVKVYESSPRS
jgi:predicted DNA-binding transcriptional regulator YafY